MAAISLALLTNNSAYYVEALDHYNTYALSTISGAMNWDGRNPAVFMSLVEAALARPALAQGAGLATNLTGWQTQMEAYLDGILEGKKSRPYFTNGTSIVLTRTGERCLRRDGQADYCGTRATRTLQV